MNTAQSRFEVGYPGYGVIEHVPSKHEAFLVAKNFCRRNGLDFVEVYDRMAHKGKTSLWKVNVTFVVMGGETVCHQVWEEQS